MFLGPTKEVLGSIKECIR